jgi:hypothetical protein
MRRLEEIWFRYFSQDTLYTEDAWVRYTVALVFLWTAFCGVIADVLGNQPLAKAFFITFTIEIGLFSLIWIVIWIYHNWRIKHESNT